MPELPEVETIKRGLAKAIVGKKISGAKVLREKSFKGSAEQIVGKKIVGISRRAKLLIIELSILPVEGTMFLDCKEEDPGDYKPSWNYKIENRKKNNTPYK